MGAITGIAGGIIAGIAMSWLARRASQTAEANGDRRVLRYGRAVRIGGWVMLATGLFIGYAASQASADQAIIATIVGSALALSGFYLWVEVHLVRVEFDENNINSFSPWRANRTIPWNDIREYKFSTMNNWHVLKTSSHGTLRLSVLLSGLGSFFQAMEKKGMANQAL